MTSFAGFSTRAVQFYADLAADNTREFWAAHKQVYETQVLEPMRGMLAELEDEFGPGKVFRPHRDLRFSADKTPYKTYQGAFVGPRVGIGYYVALDASGLKAGCGFRSHGADQVRALRAAVDDGESGPSLAAIVEGLREQGFDLETEALKAVPRGYPADHPRAELLRWRSLMAVRVFGTPAWLGLPQSAEEVRATWRSVTPLGDWVSAHVVGD